MEWTWSSLCLSFSFVVVVVVILLLNNIVICKKAKEYGAERVKKMLLPPGPPGWPVIGNLLDVGLMPHRNFYRLGDKYGPVIWLRIGSINTMLIQSPKAAVELFQKHDLAFSDRKETFFGGMESSSSSIEWAMTELLRAPSSMTKVKQELDRVIGPKRNVKESDFDRLPYLQAIVKETLRLHPSIPLIARRNAKSDVKYMGYFVPKGTQVLINSWAIGRDPEYWDEPHSFKPERFMGSSVDFKGHNFEFVPFGFGRRICVGYPLAQRVVTLGLASLLHSFDWKVCDSLNSIDMTERIGVTLRKLKPLKIVPKRRSC